MSAPAAPPVQIPTTSVMLDDGEIERRVRLIRPMDAHNVSIRMMDETRWVEADQTAFTSAWNAEVAEVPEFVDGTIHVVGGLLLPIWKRLPNESTRVYRLQTDDGERIVGRRVSPAWVAGAMAAGTSTLTPDDAFMALLDGKTIIDLTDLRLPTSSALVQIGSDLHVDEAPPSPPKDGVSGRRIGVSGKITAETSKFCHVELKRIRS
ncbi:hypothetical protein LCGC14_0658760 [marine sediment metagenome]|uniref:Uncharacterized protein n=1 Tax=marine sediment metagenome TaxID=412755 RepID=A0A0F9U2L0_9ZZZZ